MTVSKNPEQGESKSRTPHQPHESAGLDARYGEIGISAVAAALPYAGGKSPVRTETAGRIDQRFIEVAA
jgi:hypothetical protein